MSTLSEGSAKKVDDLVHLLDQAPVMGPRKRERLSKRHYEAVFAGMVNQRLTYGEASNGPEFLNQDYESFREFLKTTDQNLDWQCETVTAGFERFQETGEIPAPYYPMRIAILLRKAGDTDREKRFLAVWCRHFPSGNGVKYGKLLERARKIGAA